MARAPEHISGAKVGRTVKMSPAHWRTIDAYANTHTDGNVSAAVARLVEQAAVGVEIGEDSREESAAPSPTTPTEDETDLRRGISTIEPPDIGFHQTAPTGCTHPLGHSRPYGQAGLRQCGDCGHVGGKAKFAQ